MTVTVNRSIQFALIAIITLGALARSLGGAEWNWALAVVLPALLALAIVRFGLYRCGSCGGYLGKSHRRFCTHCGKDPDGR